MSYYKKKCIDELSSSPPEIRTGIEDYNVYSTSEMLVDEQDTRLGLNSSYLIPWICVSIFLYRRRFAKSEARARI